jgi:hypothetical protein
MTGGGSAKLTTDISVYPSDKVYKISSDGTLIYTVSGFMKPGYMVVDENQDCWVGHDVNTVTKINTSTGNKSANIRVETSDFISLSASKYDTDMYDVQQIGGINCDTSRNLIVINSPENKIFRYDVENTAVSGNTIIDSVNDTPSHMHRAFGDWSGFRWVNKYKFITSGINSLTGESTINIYSSAGHYRAAILHEDFDAAETVKSYRFQSQLLDYNKLFDTFYGQVIGDASADPTQLGKTIYQKIGNFPSHHIDIDECDINALYSLSDQYNVPMTKYNHTFIGGLQRVMNMCSVPHHKLWSTRSKSNRSFNKEGTDSVLKGINLGDEINALTYTVSAGVRFVAEQLFNREFRIIDPMYLSGASTDPGYAPSVKMLSSYPLSGYSPRWGLGLRNRTYGTDIIKYYNFYEYKDVYSDVQLEGVIDWGNPYTTLTESNSGYDVWSDDGGIVDVMLDYELRRGLNLFMSTVSGSTSAHW